MEQFPETTGRPNEWTTLTFSARKMKQIPITFETLQRAQAAFLSGYSPEEIQQAFDEEYMRNEALIAKLNLHQRILFNGGFYSR